MNRNGCSVNVNWVPGSQKIKSENEKIHKVSSSQIDYGNDKIYSHSFI